MMYTRTEGYSTRTGSSGAVKGSAVVRGPTSQVHHTGWARAYVDADRNIEFLCQLPVRRHLGVVWGHTPILAHDLADYLHAPVRDQATKTVRR